MIFLMMHMTNIMFLNSKNPLNLGILLFFQTLLMMLLMGKIFYSFWFSLIIFLIFIGGLFILFVYMISLTFNNKHYFIKLNKNYIIITFLFFILILFLLKPLILFMNEETSILHFKNYTNLNLIKFFNFPNNWINILMISYLLILMIIIIKITNYFSGPIKLISIN